MSCCCHDDDAHDLDYGDIDELDEIADDNQLALIWCWKHKVYEWHALPLCDLPGTGNA